MAAAQTHVLQVREEVEILAHVVIARDVSCEVNAMSLERLAIYRADETSTVFFVACAIAAVQHTIVLTRTHSSTLHSLTDYE
jgi:hypothetical protein